MPGIFGSLPINIQNSAAPSTPSGGVNLYANNSNLILQTPSSTYTVQQNPVWTINSAPTLPNGTSTTPGGSPIFFYWNTPSSLLDVLQNGYAPYIDSSTTQVRIDYNVLFSTSDNSSENMQCSFVAYRAVTPSLIPGLGNPLNIIKTTTNQQTGGSSMYCDLNSFLGNGPYTNVGLFFSLPIGVGASTWNVTGYENLITISLFNASA